MQIAETLDEVRAHAAAAGSPAEDEFGSPQEYAKQFPKQKTRSRGYAIALVGSGRWQSPMLPSRCFFYRSCASMSETSWGPSGFGLRWC